MLAGIDFGTSNSTCVVKLSDGRVVPVEIGPGNSNPFLMPSYWYYPDEGGESWIVGSDARKAYIEEDYAGRFMVSLKSWLSSRSVTNINVGYRPVKLEKIVAELLIKIREAVEDQYGEVTRVHAGRPAFLSDDATVSDEWVEGRIRLAYELAGFPTPLFVLEPVAAAYEYKQTLSDSELAFVADFGGGTLDYCLVNLQPSGSLVPDSILGTGGVRIGGDNMTAALMSLFWEYFGQGSHIKGFDRKKWIPFPITYFHQLSDWKHIWKVRKIADDIRKSIGWGADDPDALERLLELLDDDCYFPFLASLESLKCDLSGSEQSRILFSHSHIQLDRMVMRDEFSVASQRLMERARAAALDVFERSGVKIGDVKSVFLTGGSSQITAFQDMLADVFGREKMLSGDTFVSVGSGLAHFEP